MSPRARQPSSSKTRPVPFAIRDKVNEELHGLEKQGVIERFVQFAEWAAPLVPVQNKWPKLLMQ